MIVTHSIHIDVPPELVWDVTRDVERWPEWTPTVTSVVRADDAPFGLGSVARIRQPMQPESEWKVTRYDEGRFFAWSTARPGLRMTGSHEIVREGSGTRNTLTLEATGALSALLWPILRLATARALAAENGGLKSICERRAKA